ncbi:MAG TPA: hypothetical protein VF153_09435 [Candidatus Limnocylindria bacterium]
MSIRLDPRRLAALKLLAGEEGLRPGELVTRWVEERLDAARAGSAAPATAAAPNAELAALSKRVDELAKRLDAFTATAPAAAASIAEPAEPAEPKRRGRPPKASTTGGAVEPARATASGPRVPLHEEIMAVISERGPMTAGELATAIKERGRYSTPRSSKPFDASTVNARVSNPVYRARFTRDKGRIGLANAG